MMIIFGLMTAAGGLFLFLWYRTVVGLPRMQQPLFIRPIIFRWGVPAISLVLFLAGIFLLAGANLIAAAVTAAISCTLAYLIIKFDRYSASVRVIHSRYLQVRQANPGLGEAEVLFRTAHWRYPEWSHDRLVEMVAGKDIGSLILLMLLGEYEINPIQDWELYRSLKTKVAAIVPRHSVSSRER
jgi:hypothetical protein